MATYLVAPKKLLATAGNQASYPPSNMGIDRPSLVWRSANLTGVWCSAQLDGGQWDTISLYGTNLRATDTYRVRAASSDANTLSAPSYDSGTLSAFSGTVNTVQNMALLSLGAARTEAFVRIDITSTGNPAGYVQVERLVIGKRVEEVGVDWMAEQAWEDPSEQNTYRGAVYVDPFDTKMTWKVSLTGVTEASYMTNWVPFLRDAGNKNGVLFVPDHTSTYMQNEATFGLISNAAKGAAVSSNEYKIDLSIREL